MHNKDKVEGILKVVKESCSPDKDKSVRIIINDIIADAGVKDTFDPPITKEEIIEKYFAELKKVIVPERGKHFTFINKKGKGHRTIKDWIKFGRNQAITEIEKRFDQ